MSVLAIRLGGPLQAWGSSRRLDRYRRTEAFPTKSAVVGLLAGALGRSRTEPIDDLTEMRFGVRADRPGEVLRDFHTVSSLFDEKRCFDPSKGRLPVVSGGYRSVATSIQVTERFYLSDACFVAGMEGEEAMLNELDNALGHPVFPPYLGRRSCPPDAPLRLGVHPGSLVEVLRSIPWQGGVGAKRIPRSVRCEAIIEQEEGDRELVDEVRSFDPVKRSYGRRRVRHHYLDVVNSVSELPRLDDDGPMALLGEN